MGIIKGLWIAFFVASFSLLQTSRAPADQVVAAVGEWSPYVGESLVGYGSEAQKIRTLYRAAGVEVEFVFLPWRRSFELTRYGAYALTFPWETSSQREREFLVPSRPLFESRLVYIYNQKYFPEGLSINSVRMLQAMDLKVVGINGYKTITDLRTQNVSMHVVNTSLNAWRMLNAGRVDIHIDDESVAFAETSNFFGVAFEDRYGIAGVYKSSDIFPLFSRQHSMGDRLLQIWERTNQVTQ